MTLLTVSALAGPRTSASYYVATDTANIGAIRSASATYTIVSNVGDVTGISTAAPAQIAKQGYIAQLYDVTGLTLTAASLTVNETATVELTARQMLDDDTFLAIAPITVNWSVVSGPISGISAVGLATAGAVYQNTPASVQGSLGGFTGLSSLTVIETIPDNFGSYAGDGLTDNWQVQYFGLNNPLGGPNMDPDGDGLINLTEFAFGTDPTANGVGILRYTGTFAGGGTILSTGQPTTAFESTVNGVDFRALFVRRVDYVAVRLTYTVQFSADLATWHSSTTVPSVLADNGAFQIVSVPYPFFVSGKKARFFRVQVSTAP